MDKIWSWSCGYFISRWFFKQNNNNPFRFSSKQLFIFVHFNLKDPSSDGTCPEDSFPCACKSSSEESSTTVEPFYSTSQEIHAGEVTRCIPKSLVCNGHPNCGLECQVDESEVYCESPTSQSSNPTPTITSCTRPDPTTTVKPPTKDDGDSGGVTWNKPAETFGTILGLNAVMMMVASRLLV